MVQIGELLKSFGLIPSDHEVDHKLLLSIVDKDKDGEFTIEDFKNNIPSFDPKEVADFIQPQVVSSEDESLDSDSLQQESEIFRILKEVRSASIAMP